MVELRRRPDESEQAYIYRICDHKSELGTWYDVRDVINLELDRDWNESAYRKQYQAGKHYLETIEDNLFNNDEYIEKIRQEKEDLNIERKKLQRVNQEYQANLRRNSDYQLYREMWIDAIKNEEPIRIVEHKTAPEKIERTGVLCISDAHYGKVVELKAFNGEVVNKYSPEIFEARMWKLLNDFQNDFEDGFMIDKLVVLDLGDCIEGILRCDKTLMSLKSGVVESANQYGNFIAQWLCELYNRLNIPIEYSLCGGNHDVIRILGEKKKFDDENIAKNICEKIRDKIEINKLRQVNKTGIEPKIDVAEYNEVAFKSVYGMNIFGCHGEHKNLKNEIDFFENYYQLGIDILVCGHLHRNSQETIGYGYMGDREIIRVPSLIGADEFSKSIRKISRAGAFYMTFTPNGKEWSKTYYLN